MHAGRCTLADARWPMHAGRCMSGPGVTRAPAQAPTGDHVSAAGMANRPTMSERRVGPVPRRRVPIRPDLSAIAVLIVALVSALTVSASQASDTGVILAKGVALQSLDVVPLSALAGSADRALVASLQGLVAKSSSEQIFIEEGSPGATWKNFLNSRYGITLNDRYSTWPSLLTHFRQYVSGYLLYDMTGNPQSLNVATSLSGPLHALPVDKSQEQQVRSLGVTRRVLDVSDKDEKWAYDKYSRLFSKTTAAELNSNVYFHLRDYATMTNSFTFYDGVTDWRKQVLSDLQPGATLLGFGNNEFNMVHQASQEGVTSIPTDLAPNLSALSSIHSTEGLTQKAEPIPKTQAKHYVSFVISDGDNVAWDLWGMNQYYGNPDRGSFSVGYGISPSLVDLAPAALRWYYENASSGAAKDTFIAGPSGNGYAFPSRMPADELNRFAGRLNSYMGEADLGIAEILDDQDSFDRTDLWSTYLRQPNIDSLFYFGPGAHGQVGWVNNKPVVAQRDVLWGGRTDEGALIQNINSRPASPGTADGYTLVLVHCWTKTLSDIKTVVNGLGPDVAVVTPQEFVSLIEQNHVSGG
jgi:hypothetical protein